ncbi:SAM-dependent methyltransferase [Hyphomicrobium sp.]|uniref:SAM-dependent methyltransferase n=1 Tax=Hyphomicrobium sp. TaxID=82 RepID=UPI002D782046|nr:polysaccharide deacetylase family protein [Hyphomicrobium sp.]HET6391046.1 polysaccharide deacetylase family protein [Hyphomicrobium sp.]
MEESARWDAVFQKAGTCNDLSQYEQEKYQHTLKLLPEDIAKDALELGCAEGIFTEMLSARAERVLATDISMVAIERARERCARLSNVSFAWCDISASLPRGEFDLIVCSEILYYLQDSNALQDFSERIGSLLRPGGSLVLAHANAVADDPDSTGFDFASFGAKFIGQIFASLPQFEFSCELRTPPYRIQRFKKVETRARRAWRDRCTAALEVIEENTTFAHPALKIGGCAVVDSEARHCYRTRNIPILMYHRIASDGPTELAPYRVTPEMFARQMQFLHRHGYRTVSVDEASASYQCPAEKDGKAGRLIALTFDDGYLDFLEEAWPIMRRYGLSATVYLPTDFVGGRSDWDASYGVPAPLLSWDQVSKLSDEGVIFGAHSCSHRRLSLLNQRQLFEELNGCGEIIRSKTGQAVTSFCYPYGDENPEVRRAVADAGYENAVAAYLSDGTDRFALPRIDISGSYSLEQFVAVLPEPELVSETDLQHYRSLRALKDRRLYMS